MTSPDDLSLREPKRARALVALALLFSVSLLSACASAPSEEEIELDEASIEDLVQPEAADPDTILLAERAIREGRYDDAALLLERVLHTYPDDPRGILAVGELQLAKGHPTEALPIFARILQDPDYMEKANQGYGICLLLIGDEDLAAKHLREAVEADPQLWRSWGALGAYYDGKEEWVEAAASYQRALELKPDNANVLNNYGFSLFMQDRLDEAIDSLQTAFRLDPSSEQIKTNLRLAYARKGQYVRALSGSKENEKATNLNNVGYMALLRGDYDEAEVYFIQAMEADPRYNETAALNLDYLRTLRDLEASAE